MSTRKKRAAAPAASPGNNVLPLISEEKLAELYGALLQCRMFRERARALLKQNKLSKGSWRSLGREASAVGVVIDLLPADTLAVCGGGLSALFARRVPLRQLYASLRPSAGGAGHDRRAGGSARLKTAIQTAVHAAVHAAVASKVDKSHRIAMVFCGAPGRRIAAPASWREAMRRADAENLPMIFVCHSDSEAESVNWQTERYGFPGMVVDGNDVVAIYRVASEAIAHARRGNGPTLIDCRTARLPDTKEQRSMSAVDPVLNLENYFFRKGLSIANRKAAISAKFRRKLRVAERFFASGADARQ